MYTFGYIREATQAHIDLDEKEAQALDLQRRYYIYANEAMQAICAIKPKYDYFKMKVVEKYWPLINEGDNMFRRATLDEINWEAHGTTKPNFADEVDTAIWYTARNIYLLNTPVRMPDDFIAFAVKQAWAFIVNKQFDSEMFVRDYRVQVKHTSKAERIKPNKSHFMFTSRNTVTMFVEGEYWIPYKAVWYRFTSSLDDKAEIDMPVDALLTIPIYVASVCLQIDHAQRAMSKRAEFETALARCTTTDMLDLKSPTPSFE